MQKEEKINFLNTNIEKPKKVFCKNCKHYKNWRDPCRFYDFLDKKEYKYNKLKCEYYIRKWWKIWK